MNFKEFCKGELVEILDLIQTAVACKTEDDVNKVTYKLKELVCADMGVCALSEGTTKLLKIVNLNWPGEWAGIYTSEELYKKDPVIKYNYDRKNAFFWTEATEVYSDRPNLEVMDRASEFGLRHGLSSGICGAGNKSSIFSFASGKNNFTRHHLQIIDVVMPHIHQAFLRICESKAVTSHDLSAREMEVLRWMKEGKTNWEISIILNISERTVKFHVQNIERKLNAVNKAHAIAIALDSGLEV
ncbi:MAG: autoinducer binding domain-containing protein [Deltaproteobacteria bacterium]|nr:autoinducer binding domain-containing protein [Deltaproteobacteria bacterium]